MSPSFISMKHVLKDLPSLSGNYSCLAWFTIPLYWSHYLQINFWFHQHWLILRVGSVVHSQTTHCEWYYVSVFAFIAVYGWVVLGCLLAIEQAPSHALGPVYPPFLCMKPKWPRQHIRASIGRRIQRVWVFAGQTAHACMFVCVRTLFLTGGVCPQTHTFPSGRVCGNQLMLVGNPPLVVFKVQFLIMLCVQPQRGRGRANANEILLETTWDDTQRGR